MSESTSPMFQLFWPGFSLMNPYLNYVKAVTVYSLRICFKVYRMWYVWHIIKVCVLGVGWVLPKYVDNINLSVTPSFVPMLSTDPELWIEKTSQCDKKRMFALLDQVPAFSISINYNLIRLILQTDFLPWGSGLLIQSENVDFFNLNVESDFRWMFLF